MRGVRCGESLESKVQGITVLGKVRVCKSVECVVTFKLTQVGSCIGPNGRGSGHVYHCGV